MQEYVLGQSSLLSQSPFSSSIHGYLEVTASRLAKGFFQIGFLFLSLLVDLSARIVYFVLTESALNSRSFDRVSCPNISSF